MPVESAVVIWHNPRCSKSRGTLELLQERGVEPAIVDYQKNPPSTAEIERALQLLAIEPRDLMRKGEAAHPVLIERPIVFANGKAAIGRPPENVLAIL